VRPFVSIRAHPSRGVASVCQAGNRYFEHNTQHKRLFERVVDTTYILAENTSRRQTLQIGGAGLAATLLPALEPDQALAAKREHLQ
jgi:hypothetical protein